MDTVRLARDLSTVDSLIPEWCDGLADLPFPLFDAMGSAVLFLGWEELPSKDRPPRRMWTDHERLSEWFEMVDERRNREMKGEDADSQIEGPVSQNDAAKDLIAD